MKGYTEWEADEAERAVKMADELIEEYNMNHNDTNNMVYNKYKFTNCTKERALYTLLKVWHILSGSGIFLDYEIQKRGPSLWVHSTMTPQLKHYIDKPDSDDEAEPVNTCQ
jgi:hypothetical protein